MKDQNQQYDIVLKNGRVIDPETYFDKVCNVGIKMVVLGDHAPLLAEAHGN